VCQVRAIQSEQRVLREIGTKAATRQDHGALQNRLPTARAWSVITYIPSSDRSHLNKLLLHTSAPQHEGNILVRCTTLHLARVHDARMDATGTNNTEDLRVHRRPHIRTSSKGSRWRHTRHDGSAWTAWRGCGGQQ